MCQVLCFRHRRWQSEWLIEPYRGRNGFVYELLRGVNAYGIAHPGSVVVTGSDVTINKMVKIHIR